MDVKLNIVIAADKFGSRASDVTIMRHGEKVVKFTIGGADPESAASSIVQVLKERFPD